MICHNMVRDRSASDEERMLQKLAMRGYRGFESYRLINLARVNLVVGKNNCGKTSVLEAIELLVSGGRPAAFLRSLKRRGEMRERMGERSWDISHVFFGHRCVPGARFELSSEDSSRKLSVKILSLDEVGEEADRWGPDVKQRLLHGVIDPVEEGSPAFGMSIDAGSPESRVLLPVMEEGPALLDHQLRWIRMRNGAHETPVHFLTLESLDPASLGGMWDTVLAEGREAEIVRDVAIRGRSGAKIECSGLRDHTQLRLHPGAWVAGSVPARTHGPCVHPEGRHFTEAKG